MTNSRSRLGRLERIVDLELEARARRLFGLSEDSIAWTEIAREYREISERMTTIRARSPQSRAYANGLAEIEPEVKVLAQELGLDFDELIAEAERIMSDGGAGLETGRWLLSHL